MDTFKQLFNREKWAYGLFWSWNVIFLAFMLLGFAPTVLPEMITAVGNNEFPTNFLLYALILTLIPVAVVGLGATILRREPARLFALGYGIEGPLMLLVGLRFFVVREMTTAVWLLLITATIGILVYLWQLIDRHIAQRGPLLAHVRLVGLTMLLIIGLYVSLLIAFYAVPLAVEGVRSLGSIGGDFWRALVGGDWPDLRWVPFMILGFILFIYSATLFILMPVAVTILYSRAWWQGVRDLAASYSQPRAAALTTAVFIILAALFIPANHQPQQEAFALLEEPPATLQEAEALLEQEETIRAGLLNAYLSPQRYISSKGEVLHIRDIYHNVFNIPYNQANQVREAYEVIASPLLYQPVTPIATNQVTWQNQAMRQEPQEAAKLYEQFFDRPLVEAEREAVVHAARSTWAIDQAMSNWQAVDDREIWLMRQEVTITEHGDWAQVELYEVYQNQTSQRQEVVYYFTLPESAVITGVWLGNSENRQERFVYQVAPRGAAQATYQNQVRRNIDPALVEQLGPSQYRLRVFPIEPQTWQWEEGASRSTLEDGPPLHLWLTYQVMANDNAWPMPYLSEKLNVYWDDGTVRLVNGAEMDADEETWLPESITAVSPTSAAVHQVTFPSGHTVFVQPATTADALSPSSDLHLAVVLDRSRSMADSAAEVEAALAEVDKWGTTVDVYLTASSYRGEEPSVVSLADLDTANIVYYGGQNAAELLSQFNTLYAGQPYDAILVLTDDSGYEASNASFNLAVPSAPLWFVHLAGRFPVGYDDRTLAAIQASGGGVASSLTDAFTRLQAGQNNGTRDIVDGYVWSILAAPPDTALLVTEHDPSDPFAAFAARRVILAEMMSQRDNLDALTTLDELHALAIEHSIITPYSSMIVLVNTQQQQILDSLSDNEDRFDREFEAVGETALSPLAVTGVPEPEEWLLLILAVGMLGWYLWQNGKIGRFATR